MSHVVALVSGGIESLVVAAWMSKKHRSEFRHAVFVDYGQMAAQQELESTRAIAREYGLNLECVEMKLPFLEGYGLIRQGLMYADELAEELGVKPIKSPSVDRSHVIPYRNLFLVSIAASMADTVCAEELWLGFDYHPNLPTRTADKSPEFVAQLQDVIDTAKENSDVTLVTPLQGNTKEATIKKGVELNVNWSLSWSCYNNLSLPCGVCAQCRTRRTAFNVTGVHEGVDYHSLDFIRSQLANE